MSTLSHISPDCRIMRKADALFRDKGNGTSVHYYLFSEYEVHANTIQPNTTQEWHHHAVIIETLVITTGELEARWIDESKRVRTAMLQAGDLFEVGLTVHTFANVSSSPTTFVVFRLVPDGIDKRELIKSDRYPDADPTQQKPMSRI